MKRLTAKIREAIAKRNKWRKVANNAEAKLDDCWDALHKAQKQRDKLQKKIKKADDKDTKFAKARQRDLADKIEDVEAQIDRLVARIDDLETREENKKRLSQRYGERVGKLKKRREKIKKEKAAKSGPSPNFTYAEFDCNNGTPVPDNCKAAVDALCQNRLEKMRAKFGEAHVNSGYRTVAYNAAIGGASGSYHIYPEHPGMAAADTTYAKGSPSEWAAYARSLGVGGVGQYSTFVHIDNRNYTSHWYG